MLSTAIKAYLKNNNLENVDRSVIMQHMQNIYRNLEDLHLVQYGLTYVVFIGFAQQAFTMADLQSHFR
jgi:hypothetical protein